MRVRKWIAVGGSVLICVATFTFLLELTSTLKSKLFDSLGI